MGGEERAWGDKRGEMRGGEWMGGGWERSDDAGWEETRSYVNRALHARLLHVCGNTLFEIDSCASLFEFSFLFLVFGTTITPSKYHEATLA